MAPPDPLNLPTDWQLEAEPELSPEPDAPPVAAPSVATRITAALEPDAPPPADRILEALLFVGGPPLTPDATAAAIRGFTAERLREAVDRLNKTYRTQNRPYSIQPQSGGYILAVKPAFRGVREKLFGGPREARLSQPALDVLSLIAYRQPIPKADVDALRGADCGSILRQLVRLGLAAVTRRGESDNRELCYGTTPRFLDLFGLTALDDLPRLADAAQ